MPYPLLLAVAVLWSAPVAAAVPPCPRDAAQVVATFALGEDLGRCEVHRFEASEWIEEARYCDIGAGAKLLIQKRKAGTPTYMYVDVPREVWEAFKAAPSAGRFFNREIVRAYACRKSDD